VLIDSKLYRAHRGDVHSYFSASRLKKETKVMKKVFFSFIICFLFCNYTIGQGIKMLNFKIDLDGKMTWQTENEKANANFEIKEFRWNKYLLIGEIKGKGPGNNSYSFLADTSCSLYHVRLTVVDSIPRDSEKVSYNLPKEIKITSNLSITKKTPIITLSARSKYEVYDQYGNELLKGCDNSINTKKLLKGLYYVCFGNNIIEIIKM